MKTVNLSFVEKSIPLLDDQIIKNHITSLEHFLILFSIFRPTILYLISHNWNIYVNLGSYSWLDEAAEAQQILYDR